MDLRGHLHGVGPPGRRGKQKSEWGNENRRAVGEIKRELEAQRRRAISASRRSRAEAGDFDDDEKEIELKLEKRFSKMINDDIMWNPKTDVLDWNDAPIFMGHDAFYEPPAHAPQAPRKKKAHHHHHNLGEEFQEVFFPEEFAKKQKPGARQKLSPEEFAFRNADPDRFDMIGRQIARAGLFGREGPADPYNRYVGVVGEFIPDELLKAHIHDLVTPRKTKRVHKTPVLYGPGFVLKKTAIKHKGTPGKGKARMRRGGAEATTVDAVKAILAEASKPAAKAYNPGDEDNLVYKPVWPSVVQGKRRKSAAAV